MEVSKRHCAVSLPNNVQTTEAHEDVVSENRIVYNRDAYTWTQVQPSVSQYPRHISGIFKSYIRSQFRNNLSP